MSGLISLPPNPLLFLLWKQFHTKEGVLQAEKRVFVGGSHCCGCGNEGLIFGGCLLLKWDECEGGGVFVYRNPKLIESRGCTTDPGSHPWAQAESGDICNIKPRTSPMLYILQSRDS